MAMINQKQRFATSGFRIMRANPDGTLPVASRFVGFTGTADLSGVLTTHLANLTVKVDGTSETKSVDFSAAVDETAVTVAEAVTALTTSAFTGITWSSESGTSRLKGVSASGTYVQVTGNLAAALDFGQGITFGGQGLEFLKYFNDETMSIGLSKNMKDKEEIDSEGALGTITRMVIGQKLQGLSPVITLKIKDYALLELIQGGVYDRTSTPSTYDPPLSDESEHPTFWVEIYSPIYSAGTTKLESKDGYEKILIRSCIGMEGDVPIEAKAWASYAFNIEATEYIDESSVKHPAYQESTITLSQFTTLDVTNV
jgi:hypothetical protein